LTLAVWPWASWQIDGACMWRCGLVAWDGVKPDPSDELFCWDYWEFKGGIGKTMTVYMKSPHNEHDSEFAYEGPLCDDFIQEFED
jgi:hypothetical protein